MESLLEIKNLSLGFVAHKTMLPALDNVSIAINPGEIIGVVGESGCGKSITALSIMGLLPKESTRISGGSIRFENKNLLETSEEALMNMRGKNIAMIFQEPMSSLNPLMSVEKQLMEPVCMHLNMNRQQAREHIIGILEKTGIPRSRNILSDYPYQLSGGMRQRVMIAMALSCNPSLLIADEPTTALDVTIQAQILDLLKQARDQFKASVLLITHDLGVVEEICDRVYVMYAGQVVENGNTQDIIKTPRHPYTQGLLRSMPTLETQGDRLETIPGMVPSLHQMPAGCRFSPRCAFADQRCRQEPPIQKHGQQMSKCWLA